MALVKVKPLEELCPGDLTEIRVGEGTYVVCNVDGNIYCLTGTCPHAGGPLAQGSCNAGTLVCPWHGWEFDCRTGLSDSSKRGKLDTFPVVLQDGFILIDVPVIPVVSVAASPPDSRSLPMHNAPHRR